MRLLALEIEGYRRFAPLLEDPETGEQTAATPAIDLDGDVVCIVGPNAAGKSSLLDALHHLNTDSGFSHEEGTRVPDADPMTPFVRARFALEKEDQAVLGDIPEAKNARQFLVSKRGDEGREYEIEPRPEFEPKGRNKIGERVAKLGEHDWPASTTGPEGSVGLGGEDLTEQMVRRATAALQSDQEELDDAQIDRLKRLRDRLRAVINGEHTAEVDELPRTFHRIVSDLDGLIENEEARSPNSRATAALRRRVPQLLKFDESRRNLSAAYDLNGERDPAVENLLALAETSWDAALAVVGSEDKGRKSAFLDNTRAKLEEEITQAWGQRSLTVRFDLDGSVLTILMSMEADDWITIDQHSDGLRQFVALRAFIASEDRVVKPIVLIDEADTHLHYDAQADLVTVFEEQEEAAQIIYTTHSAGCLPRDIGVGIRAVVPLSAERKGKLVETDHSEILNKFWVKERGFSPLLIAMGASAFAFSATQKALVTEGMSDAILLPSLIREALGGVERLDYQVVPSFAEARPKDVPEFDYLASRVAYAADGDDGGRAHAKKLTDNGVLAEQIIYLGGKEDSQLSLEDLLVKEVYVEAVNEELGRWHDDIRFPADQLPETGRSKAVKDWCAQQKDSEGGPIELSKSALAQRVLEKRHDRALIPAAKRTHLKKLDKEAMGIFEKATQHLAESQSAGET